MELTSAVYKVTAIFPTGEELSLKIRKLADIILTDLLNNKCVENGSRYVGEILKLFDLAEKKNWVDPRNFLVLKREYAAYSNSTESSCRENSTQSSNNHRQYKIIEAINGSKKIKIGELVSLFPGVNRRTVLRDLDKLCQTGIMVRNGIGRGVYYVKNGSSTSP